MVQFINGVSALGNTYFMCFIFLGILPTAVSAHNVAANADTTLKVVTYNIKHGTDLVGQKSIVKQAAFLNMHQPDLLSIQEVDKLTKRSGLVDQTSFFAHKLALNSVFQRFMHYDDGEYGIAAFSKFPVLSKSTINLPNGLEPRNFPMFTVDVAQQPLIFVPVHFDWPTNDNQRFAQAKALLAALNTQYPVILAGDFNDIASSRTMLLFKQAGFDFHQKNKATYLGSDVEENILPEIDFIAVRSGNKVSLSLLDSKVIENNALSDHAPVVSWINVSVK